MTATTLTDHYDLTAEQTAGVDTDSEAALAALIASLAALPDSGISACDVAARVAYSGPAGLDLYVSCDAAASDGETRAATESEKIAWAAWSAAEVAADAAARSGWADPDAETGLVYTSKKL